MHSHLRHIRNRILILLASVVFLCLDLGVASDLFPLLTGRQSTYRYQCLFESWNYGQYLTIRDSGYTQYSIRVPTTTNDSAIVWDIVQSRDFNRHVRSNLPLSDTTIRINDSILFTITEQTVGYHKLQSSILPWSSPSNLSAWRFPLAVSSGDPVPVYRYADSSHAVVSGRAVGCYSIAIDHDYDSLLMSADSGITRRAISICIDQDEIGSIFWGTFDLVSLVTLSVDETQAPNAISRLLANYPNPFNPTSTVTYDLEFSGPIRLVVYDVLGREVTVLANEFQQSGQHQFVFDGSSLPSGVYVIRLTAKGQSMTHGMILLR